MGQTSPVLALVGDTFCASVSTLTTQMGFCGRGKDESFKCRSILRDAHLRLKYHSCYVENTKNGKKYPTLIDIMIKLRIQYQISALL